MRGDCHGVNSFLAARRNCASCVRAGTSSPSGAPRGGPHLSRDSAPSKGSAVQDHRTLTGHFKTPRPALGSYLKLLRALSGAASGQVLSLVMPV